MPKRLFWLLLMVLACGPALALGLGQIEVKSRHGEPLLAEIPIVSSDPGELEQLQARLASPETFARVGLQPPTGLVSDLRFTVALDARGRPVIRVTTDAPVQQAALNFLLEVDWGQGRLVREYAALVDTPETVAAIAQPAIQAPVPAPSDAIVRAPATVAGDAVDVAGDPASTTGGAADAASAEPDTAPVAAAAADAPATPPPSMPAPAPAAAPAQVTVQAGQTLSGIAAGFAAREGRSLNEAMVALLRANPDAFIRGNVNLLREGAVLRTPDAASWDGIDARQATALVREHVAQWRQARRPVPQPVESVDTTAAAGAAPRRTTDARLAIVPPSGGTNQAGTRSGISAGGEGDMLRQQELTEARETIAARTAEVDELKARIAELEQLQQQQAQLIRLKDGELAAAQQRLAESNAQAATTPAAPAPDAQASQMPWLWIGIGVLMLALLAWWWSRRRGARPDTPRSFLASAAPDAAPSATAHAAQEPRLDPAAAMEASGWAPSAERVDAAEPDAAPAWHAASGSAPAPEIDRVASVAPLNPAPAGQERIELARAYLDLGDVDTARTLLQEVADTGDAASRGVAARLLRELV